jgi:hypothetical protein
MTQPLKFLSPTRQESETMFGTSTSTAPSKILALVLQGRPGCDVQARDDIAADVVGLGNLSLGCELGIP